MWQRQKPWQELLVPLGEEPLHVEESHTGLTLGQPVCYMPSKGGLLPWTPISDIPKPRPTDERQATMLQFNDEVSNRLIAIRSISDPVEDTTVTNTNSQAEATSDDDLCPDSSLLVELPTKESTRNLRTHKGSKWRFWHLHSMLAACMACWVSFLQYLPGTEIKTTPNQG